MEEIVRHSQKESPECSWCGDFEPLVDSDTQKLFPVIVLPGTDGKFGQLEYFHEPCHNTLMRCKRVTDAIKATGWTQAEFLTHVDELADEIEENSQ